MPASRIFCAVRWQQHTPTQQKAVFAVKVTYDPQSDILRILLSTATIEDMSTEQPGIIFNYDDDGQLIGLEILDASKRVEDPLSVEYAVLSKTE